MMVAMRVSWPLQVVEGDLTQPQKLVLGWYNSDSGAVAQGKASHIFFGRS